MSAQLSDSEIGKMSEISNLSYHDIKEVFTIIGECRELGMDDVEWRMHLFQRLRTLLHADVVMGGEIARNAAGVPAPTVSVDVGFDAPDDVHYMTLLENEPEVIGSSVLPIVQRAVRGDPAVTRERRQLITDDAWYGSRFFNEYVRQSKLDRLLEGRSEKEIASC